ncbi:ATP-dependent endonuclease [uncultured Megasphaera sp.]|nr:AAA family ATPase [uncultured Megasphaera sp.]
MRIKNYRNFEDVEMTFHRRANYLVGENAIGKSGFLRLLSLLSGGAVITEQDYRDAAKPIVIYCSLRLLENETEYFADSPAHHRQEIIIRLEKRVDELFPRLYDESTGERLSIDSIRRVRYVSNEPAHDCEDDVPARVYRELEELLCTYGQMDLGALTPEIKEFIRHEEEVGAYDSAYYIDIFILSHLFSREDLPRADNIKFISLVALKLLTQIYMMAKSRAVPLEHTLIVDAGGRRFLPLFVSFDEPEVHLHPYMQRGVLQYLKSILNNEDEVFTALLKGLFGIDGLRGQIFVVTHSTDSLVDDYRNIIRFYRASHSPVQAACGATFHFDGELEKHLIMHFPEVKEALYSRSVIIVEGESEYGCFRLFGETLGIPFDYYGICLINARGESSISKIRKLLRYFKIPTVSLYDADVKGNKEAEKYVFFTDEICFEMDIVKTLLQQDKRKLLNAITDSAVGEHARATADMLKKACRKLNLNYHDYPPRLLWNVNPRNTAQQEVYYFAWLYSNKGVILGRVIGQLLGRREIPPSFVRIIRAAGYLAKVTGR